MCVSENVCVWVPGVSGVNTLVCIRMCGWVCIYLCAYVYVWDKCVYVRVCAYVCV